MRKVVLVLVGVVIGALTWQVGFAAPPPLDTLVVCERPGADLRSPAANGTCPSGYTKTEISETAPPTIPITKAYVAQGGKTDWVAGDVAGSTFYDQAKLQVPPGLYQVDATGEIVTFAGTAEMSCAFSQGGGGVRARATSTEDHYVSTSWVASVGEDGKLSIQCDLTAATTDAASAETRWRIRAIKIDTFEAQAQ